MARLVLCAVLVATLCCAVPASAQAAAQGGPTTRPACKKGLNARKCRCPKNARLVKVGRRWKCVKRRATKPARSTAPTAPNAPSASTTPTAPSGGGTTPAQPQATRDDAALFNLLVGQALQKPSNTDRGYSFHTYNFLPEKVQDVTADGRTYSFYKLRYCTYSNYGGTGSRENFDGIWAVEEGFTSPAAPGAAFGKVLVHRSGTQPWSIGTQISPSEAKLDVGASAPWEGGGFKVLGGRATTDCEQFVDGG